MDKKKDDQQENNNFLSGHEDLLSSINTPEPEETNPAPEKKNEPAPKAKPEFAPKKEAAGKSKKEKDTSDKEQERTSQEEKRHQDLINRQALEEAEVKDFLNLIIKYAKPSFIAVIIVCAFFLTNSFFKNNRIKKQAKADTALMQASTAADLQAVLDDFGSTPSAPLALMRLAQKKFNAGQINEATALYSKFLKKYGKHEMATQARLNQITCTKSEGKQQEAADQFGEFAKTYETSPLAPVALLSQARCLEELSKFDEAKHAYEDLIVNHPRSNWTQDAEHKLKILQSKLK